NLKILGASMNQLGRSVYAICKENDEKKVIDVLNSYKNDCTIFNLAINSNGPYILNSKKAKPSHS
ncbi:MAG: hypothetical protein ACXACB_14635, partial [Promethearchaeota archaeon]